jgi:hypothetical protein
MATVPTTARLRRGLSLASARAALRQPERRALLFWWVLAWLALMVCALMRGYMDNVGLPVHGDTTERAIFGSLPSERLQDNVYPLAPGAFAWGAAAVHGSWFIVPWLTAILVSWKRPDRIGSFFLCWIALHFIVNPMFAVFPLQPPWMASPEVTRIISIHMGSSIPDDNPLAAMPSLHVALPLLIGFWFFREQWRKPALAMMAYAALVAFEVTLSGEHYIIDIAGAVAVSGAIAVVLHLGHKRALGRVPSRPMPAPDVGVAQSVLPAPSGRSGDQRNASLGLASSPAVILALTTVLIVVVAAKVALAL